MRAFITVKKRTVISVHTKVMVNDMRKFWSSVFEAFIELEFTFPFAVSKSLVNTNLFYTNFTNMHFQKVPIPHLTRTMKQKFLH